MKNIFISSSETYRGIFALFIDTFISWNTRNIKLQAKMLNHKIKLLTSSRIATSARILFLFIVASWTLNAQDKSDKTLPVELVYFYAEVYEDSILLKFGTATEVSNYGFEIERAQNNLNFEIIGFVDGNGNSNSPKYYTFADTLVEMSGIVYYRLKQIDFIGSFEYSDTVIVNFLSSITLESSNIPFQFNVSNNYPNPFNPATKINFELPSRQSLEINLYDINGKLVKEIASQEFFPGFYQLYLDFNIYSSGIYFVRFESQKNSVTKRITYIK